MSIVDSNSSPEVGVRRSVFCVLWVEPLKRTTVESHLHTERPNS